VAGCASSPGLVPSGDPGLAPFPYTPEAIRAHNAPGTAVTFEVHAGESVSRLTFRWTGGDERVAEYDQTVTDADGRVLQESSERTAWVELQRHAAFPAAGTTITEERVEGPTGPWECWHYTVQRDGNVEHYWFAKEKPGPPVRVRVEHAGTVVQTMELAALER
jgi:hypothetical protein